MSVLIPITVLAAFVVFAIADKIRRDRRSSYEAKDELRRAGEDPTPGATDAARGALGKEAWVRMSDTTGI
ncbi:hypothetical protein [Microbacterium kunmingense]|uniref:hypothetical protein n=1 Tax=Microbacterium kunmingense TaxID=2915939 RepID=UPI002002AE49|nr:hypothetical protein [Microbacterium kunmingense]